MDFAQHRNIADQTPLRATRWRVVFAILSFVLMAAGQFAHAAIPVTPPPPAIITLAWDPSPSTNVTGYNVYYGTAPRTYSTAVNAGFSTTQVITNLTRGATYYFSATALDQNGLESEYSSELAYTVPIIVNPRLTLTRNTTGAFSITATGIQNYQYAVLASEDMISWRNVATVTANSTGQIQWSDPTSGSYKRRYYRLQQMTQ